MLALMRALLIDLVTTLKLSMTIRPNRFATSGIGF